MPEPLNSSTLSINNHKDQLQQPLTPPAPQEQQNEAKLMATKLHKRCFIDTGCLTNARATEKENIIALYMYHTLGKFNPSNIYVQTSELERY